MEKIITNIKSLSEFFYQKATNKNILISAIAYLILGILIMPRLIPLIEGNSGLKILDIRFGYTATQVSKLFEAIGALGQKNYLLFTATADMAYPLVYGLFLCLFISYLFEKAFLKTHSYRFLNLLPLFIVISDYVENISIISLLSTYPAISTNLVKIGSFATLFKWGATIFSILIVFLGIFGWSFKSFFQKRKK